MVEVFSVFIGRRKPEDLNLYGMINFIGCGEFTNLFHREKENPYHLPIGTNFIQLEGPNPNRGLKIGYDRFFLYIDLQDVEGHLIIKGCIDSCYEFVERYKHWFDRHHCSVVQSANMDIFAALHYNIFSSPVTAKLKVHFFFKEAVPSNSSQHPCRISGSVVAFHSKYDYTTEYEKRYYRSVLFECPESCPLIRQEGVDFEMELSRVLVTVPTDCSLLIAVDLSCGIGLTTERLEETVEFQICDSSKEIRVEGFTLM